MDFEFGDDQRLLKDSVDRLMADRYGFEARKRHAREAGRMSHARCGRNTPSSACSGCPSPKTMAGSAAARSRP